MPHNKSFVKIWVSELNSYVNTIKKTPRFKLLLPMKYEINQF